METTINERLRILYKKEHLTLKLFGEKIGVAQGTLNNMFSRGTNPSFDILYKIAVAFPNYSLNWLVSGNGDMLIDPVEKHIGTMDIAHEGTVEYSKIDYREKCIRILKETIKIQEDRIKLQDEIIKKFIKHDE